MGTIKLLDEKTINEIAAGEVVERPYSVVKELVENSIDSMATEIIIEIKNGGKSYIRITDNGNGITNNDIGNSVLRHATSKISHVSDLYSLETLGFRGEALSSISAVSKFEITSKSENEEMGKSIKIAGGITISEQFTGTSNGTTVIVRELFYNIPARKKFLKSDKSEGSAITDLITRLSLINTDISFKLIKDGNIIITTPKNTSELNVISSVLGNDFSKSLMEIEYSSETVEMRCYITNLNYYRANRKMQLIYVNNRFIIDKDISSSIEKAYSTMLPRGKFPGFILHITLNPAEIDVNIHPQKSKIKFNDVRFLEDLLFSLISKKLRSRFLSKSVWKNSNNKITGFNNKSDPANVSEQIKVFTAEEISDGFEVKASELNSAINNDADFFENNTSFDLNSKIYESNDYIDTLSSNSNNENEIITIDIDSIENSYNIIYKELIYIGSIFDSYLIYEDRISGNMFLMDQHAAHERINYEKFISQFNTTDIVVQKLLVPELVHLDLKEYNKILLNLDIFSKLGFDVEDFGSKAIRIIAIPIVFTSGNIKSIFYDILDNIDQKKINGNMGDYINKLIKKACVSSVKAGDKLGKLEREHLLNDLSTCRSPFTCPHGRPIWIRYSKHEIEKSFNRIN